MLIITVNADESRRITFVKYPECLFPILDRCSKFTQNYHDRKGKKEIKKIFNIENQVRDFIDT